MPKTKVTVKIIEKDTLYNKIFKETKKLDTAKTLVGLFSDKTTNEGMLVAAIAAINEFGTNNAGVNGNVVIPERPFMRNWFDINIKETISFVNKLYKNVQIGRITANDAVRLLGEYGVTGIKESIIKLDTPPNAPSTIAKKRSSNPLIDTGQMLNSVTHKDIVKK